MQNKKYATQINKINEGRNYITFLKNAINEIQNKYTINENSINKHEDGSQDVINGYTLRITNKRENDNYTSCNNS